MRRSETLMPFPFDPAPATLWTLTHDEKPASCEIAFVPIGVEARVLTNGKLIYAKAFPSGDEALQWAEDQRQEHLRERVDSRVDRDGVMVDCRGGRGGRQRSSAVLCMSGMNGDQYWPRIDDRATLHIPFTFSRITRCGLPHKFPQTYDAQTNAFV